MPQAIRRLQPGYAGLPDDPATGWGGTASQFWPDPTHLGCSLYTGAAAVAAWLLLAALPALAQGLPESDRSATLIRGAMLIDGQAAEALPQTDILIENGRIADIGPTGTLRAPRGVMIVDAAGKVVIPGIINLRGLAGFVQSPERPQDHFQRDETIAQLGKFAAYGVTTTVTLGPDGAALARIRRDIESGAVRSAARVVTPVRALATSGRGLPRHPGIRAAFQIVESPAEGRRAVDQLASEGAQLVELRAIPDPVRPGNLEAASTAIVERAAHHDLRAMVVTSSNRSASRLVRGGARIVASSITDGEVSDAFLSLLLETGTVYAPALSGETAGFEYGEYALWLNDRYLRRSLDSGISPLLRGPVRMQQALDPDRGLKLHKFDTARRNLRRIQAAGVEIGFASTSGFPGTFEGYSDYREAVLMRRAGIPAMSVIRAFSSGSAKALGIDRTGGALRPGSAADLVILNANPLDNIHNLREMHAVLIGGRLARL